MLDMRTSKLVVLAWMLCSCGGGSNATSNDASSSTIDGSTGDDASTSCGASCPDGSTSASDATTSDATTSPPTDAGACIGSDVAALAGGKVLVGASMTSATAKAAPFDVSYQYLSGGLFDGPTPCTTCPSCTSSGTSCGHSGGGHGCAWWGCWQGDSDPPGAYLRNIVSGAHALGQIGAISYYEVLQASKVAEGDAEVLAMNNASFTARYLADWAFVAKQVGTDVAFLHIEPDFWGYAEKHALASTGSDPHKIPAAVSGFPDCASMENSIAGLGHCMIAIAHKYAPNAKVGLHASEWGNNKDAIGDPTVDVVAQAKAVATFLKECGASDGDVVFTDVDDRDAGFRGKTGSYTTTTGPGSYAQLFSWGKVVAETIGKPIVWWQIPCGNAAQGNTTNHYKDNAVDYMMSHLDDIAAAHGVALLFGAGAPDQTTPETDGGNLIAKVKAYKAAGGTTFCK
jgi:hypothetical protein